MTMSMLTFLDIMVILLKLAELQFLAIPLLQYIPFNVMLINYEVNTALLFVKI